MRIACLQFAPQVGDVDNNLNRADSILNKAKTSDLEDLDLLVLPELAFSGYNFKSLQHITPFLEPPGSGISSLWARTTALKYDCSVVVGYPEKVDVRAQWPASPEYYNSALIVNGDGDTIANYRKSFLYYTDETWALEGKEGFFQGEVPRLGNTALGICMDLNPYKFEAPWDDFEFGFHALDVEANVVILTMAWTTQQDTRTFSRRPQDPDIDTLVYWVQRLEPLVRADREGEIIVVFCNRTGTEDDVTYVGTSAVLGIADGEVYVYGILGRGVKDLLVVDTDDLPLSKLTDAAKAELDQRSHAEEMAQDSELEETETTEYVDMDEAGAAEIDPVDTSPQADEVDNGQEAPSLEEESAIISEDEDDDLGPLPSSANLHLPSAPFSGRVNTLRSQLKLIIPTGTAINDPTPIESAIDDDIFIDSPGRTNPSSPVQVTKLPKLVIPASPWRFRKKPSPYPWQQSDRAPQIFGGNVSITPITPFDTGSPLLSTKSGPHSALMWRSALPAFSKVPESIPEDEVQVQGQHQGPLTHSRRSSREKFSRIVAVVSSRPLEGQEGNQQLPQASDLDPSMEEETSDLSFIEDEIMEEIPENDQDTEEKVLGPLTANLGHLSAILEGLRLAQGCTPSSLCDDRPPPPPYELAQSPCPERPYSPKSLNASRNTSRNQSRSRLMQLRDPAADERITSISRGTIPISVSPSVFDAEYYRPQSIPISASPSLFSNTDATNSPVVAPAERPVSRLGHRISKISEPLIEGGKRPLHGNPRSLSLPAVHETKPQARSASIAGYRDIGANGHKRRRSSLRTSTTDFDETAKSVSSRDNSRSRSVVRRNSSRTSKTHSGRQNVSRGRQPAARGTSVDRSNSVGETRSQVSRRQSLQSREQHVEIERPQSKPQRRRARTSSAKSGPRQTTPGFSRHPAPAVDVPLPPSDAGTEMEADDTGNNDDKDQVLVGRIKRIAPDCPHHSPFRRAYRVDRLHRQPQPPRDGERVPPPPPVPPPKPSSAPPFSALSSVFSSAGGLLSASSLGGFSAITPMSPETPSFFGNGGGASGTDVHHHKPLILSDLVSTSTVTSPITQMEAVVISTTEGVDDDCGEGLVVVTGTGGKGKGKQEDACVSVPAGIVNAVTRSDVSLDTGMGNVEGVKHLVVT